MILVERSGSDDVSRERMGCKEMRKTRVLCYLFFFYFIYVTKPASQTLGK